MRVILFCFSYKKHSSLKQVNKLAKRSLLRRPFKRVFIKTVIPSSGCWPGLRCASSCAAGTWCRIKMSEDNARNWTRYWKPEIQRYLYGYQAVTGVDLMNEVTDTREAEVRYLQPSALLQRR